VPEREEYLALPRAERLARLARTPDDVAQAIAGRDDAALSRRAPDGWSAKEVVCHLRDVEELVILRYHSMLVMDDPKLFSVGGVPDDAEAWGIAGDVPFPLPPERWAEERQYQRNDAQLALQAFRRRRREVLALLGGLSEAQWRRGGIHGQHGRWSVDEWAAASAGHDDNHLAQLTRALDV
jgi:hypothetical protein